MVKVEKDKTRQGNPAKRHKSNQSGRISGVYIQ